MLVSICDNIDWQRCPRGAAVGSGNIVESNRTVLILRPLYIYISLAGNNGSGFQTSEWLLAATTKVNQC